MLIGLTQGFDAVGFIGVLVYFVIIVFSIAYVHYPKSKMARSSLTRLALVVMVIFTIVFVLGALLVAGLIGLFSGEVDPDDEFDGIWKFFYIYLLIMALVPIFHCIIILIIWRQRVRIALKVQQNERYKINQRNIGNMSNINFANSGNYDNNQYGNIPQQPGYGGYAPQPAYGQQPGYGNYGQQPNPGYGGYQQPNPGYGGYQQQPGNQVIPNQGLNQNQNYMPLRDNE